MAQFAPGIEEQQQKNSNPQQGNSNPQQEHSNPKQKNTPWNDNPGDSGIYFYQQKIAFKADKDGKSHGTCQQSAWDNCIQVAKNSGDRMSCDTWKKIYGDFGKFITWGFQHGYNIWLTKAKDQAAITDDEKNEMKQFINKYINMNGFKCIQFSIKYRENGGGHRVVMIKDQNQWWYLDGNLFPIRFAAEQPAKWEQLKEETDKELKIYAGLPYTGKVPDKFWQTIIDSEYFNGNVYIVSSRPNGNARANDYGEMLSNQYYDNEKYNNKYIPIMNNDYHYNQYYQNQQQKHREAQLLLSPPPQQPVAILPVQYGLSNGNHIYSQNEWLSVLLPILIVGVCLFGIICIICMGFGGLFCYREGQKSNRYKYQQRDCKYYHKLPQRDIDDYNNKKDQGLAHYDENV